VTKKARLLKWLRSEEGPEGEDLEAQTFEEILKKIKKAGAAGQLWNADNGASSTAHFWARQVVATLQASGAKEPAKVALLKTHFPAFLLKARESHAPKSDSWGGWSVHESSRGAERQHKTMARKFVKIWADASVILAMAIFLAVRLRTIRGWKGRGSGDSAPKSTADVGFTAGMLSRMLNVLFNSGGFWGR